MWNDAVRVWDGGEKLFWYLKQIMHNASQFSFIVEILIIKTHITVWLSNIAFHSIICIVRLLHVASVERLGSCIREFR